MPAKVRPLPGLTAIRIQPLMALLGLVVAATPAFADFDVARELYRAGEYAKAAEEVLVSLELAPDYAYGRALLGNCRLKLGEYDAAAEAFGRARRIEPDKPGHRLMLVQALYLADRGEEALAELSAVPEEQLGDPETARRIARWRGLVLARLGRCDEAVGALTFADASEPAVAQTLSRCARRPGTSPALHAAIDARRSQRALAVPEAVALASAHVEAADYEQDVTRRPGIYAAAATWIAAETAELSKDPALLVLLGRARVGAGDLEGAERALEHALSAPGAPCRAWLTLAESRARGERWDSALEAARHAVACEPEHARAHVLLAASFNGLSRPDEAEQAARGALAIGESREARRQIAVAEAIREELASQEAQREADEEARRRWKAITGTE